MCIETIMKKHYEEHDVVIHTLMFRKQKRASYRCKISEEVRTDGFTHKSTKNEKSRI